MRYTSIVRRPDGRIIRRPDDSADFSRYEIAAEELEHWMHFNGLDTTEPYYDVEFTFTDVGNGRSLTGSYRYKLK